MASPAFGRLDLGLTRRRPLGVRGTGGLELRCAAVAFWHLRPDLRRLWAQDDDSPAGIEAIWGEERARLAFVREAHRLLRANRLELAPDPR